MLIIAIILFILAAIFGLALLAPILTNKPTPKLAVFVHGLAALTALLVVSIYIFLGHLDPLLISSGLLFILAALGGLTLFTLDMKEKPIPKIIVALHPLIAFIALLLLVIYILP